MRDSNYRVVYETIANNSCEFVSPESDELLDRWKIRRIALNETSRDSREITHVKDVVKL